MEFLEKMISYTPNKPQYQIEKMGFYAFAHFGMNTFTGKEWGDGKASPSLFNPTDLDTDQWCRVLRDSGMKGIIATAKHHDGFCLWDTKTTDYSVKNSPFKKDVLALLRASCDKYGLKLGVYLSPWDRHSELYGTPKYNDFYIAQMTEILSNYGDLFCVWLDGACGAYMDGKPPQEYDFDRYYALIRKLQPNCAISNCGPDVRWIGNEGGICRDSEYNVVPKFVAHLQSIQDNSQTADGDAPKKGIGVIDQDLGSRQLLAQYEEYMWYPAEVDVSIRPGWFYHKNQDKKVRSVNNLLNIYYNSVGGNAMLLLNIPPDCEGKIANADVKRLAELTARIDSAFAKKVDIKSYDATTGKKGFEIDKLISGMGVFSPQQVDNTVIEVTFDRCVVDKLLLQEDINFSQRIEAFDISVGLDGKWKTVNNGTVVGHNKIALFEPIEADCLKLEIKSCRCEPYIQKFEIYETDYNQPPKPKFNKLIKAAHEYFYKKYVKREDAAREALKIKNEALKAAAEKKEKEKQN